MWRWPTACWPGPGKTPFAADVAAAAREAAGFAAWLHADMYDIGSARAYYRMAVGRARQAGHDLLAGYMLGSLAAFEIRLACEALAVGVTYSSERIIDRARRFRREYSGPATSYVRDFDDQLRSAML